MLLRQYFGKSALEQASILGTLQEPIRHPLGLLDHCNMNDRWCVLSVSTDIISLDTGDASTHGAQQTVYSWHATVTPMETTRSVRTFSASETSLSPITCSCSSGS